MLYLRVLGETLLVVIVCNRHRLTAAVDNSLLSIRSGSFIAYRSASAVACEVRIGAGRAIAEPIVQ